MDGGKQPAIRTLSPQRFGLHGQRMSVVGKQGKAPQLRTKNRCLSSILIFPSCGETSLLLQGIEVRWLAIGDIILSSVSYTTLLVPQTG